MTPRRHYERAPAIEVSIMFGCEFEAPPSQDHLLAFASAQAGAYPLQELLQAFQFGVRLSSENPPQQESQLTFGGVVRRDEAGRRAFQARPDGLLFVKLRPYSEWEAVIAESRRLWTCFVETQTPRQLTSLQVRYVNQFDLLLPIPRLDKFFRTVPVVAEELPQQLSAFVLQVNLPQPDSPNTLAVVREVTIPPARPGVVSLVFDVQVSRSVNLRPDDEKIWSELEDLHDRENRIFEASITDTTRELIS